MLGDLPAQSPYRHLWVVHGASVCAERGIIFPIIHAVAGTTVGYRDAAARRLVAAMNKVSVSGNTHRYSGFHRPGLTVQFTAAAMPTR